MSSYRIAVLPGDGIGPEVSDATVEVLQAACSGGGPQLEMTDYAVGAAHFRATGEILPDDVMANCRKADAVLLAALGLPDVRQKDGTEVQPLMMVGLRRGLALHSAVRPVKLYPGVTSPLRDVGAGIDMIILRENLEGLFASFGGGTIVADQAATDTLVVTRAGTTKVCEYAFQLARRRTGRPRDGRRLVSCVDKANVFRSFAFFRRIFTDVARQYADIDTEAIYVDAASLYMVQRPWDFDVLVMENQFGDILSDLGAGIVGGLGLGPSAEVGDRNALFQPSHGSAPDLAGKNVANPIATILSGAMMLDWLGHRHDDPACNAAAVRIEQAVSRVLGAQQIRTRDLGGDASTTEMTRAIVGQL